MPQHWAQDSHRRLWSSPVARGCSEALINESQTKSPSPCLEAELRHQQRQRQHLHQHGRMDPAGRAPRSLLLPQSLFSTPPSCERRKPHGTAATVAVAAAAAAATAVSSAANREATTQTRRPVSAPAVTPPPGPSKSGHINNSVGLSDIALGVASRVPGCNGRCAQHSWEARSRLPFHMLPFEVQAYHLQQHSHQQQGGRNSSMSSSPATTRSDTSSIAATTPIATVTTSSSPVAAVVESAWFPLMPPAMAGQEVIVSPSSSPVRGIVEGRDDTRFEDDDDKEEESASLLATLSGSAKKEIVTGKVDGLRSNTAPEGRPQVKDSRKGGACFSSVPSNVAAVALKHGGVKRSAQQERQHLHQPDIRNIIHLTAPGTSPLEASIHSMTSRTSSEEIGGKSEHGGREVPSPRSSLFRHTASKATLANNPPTVVATAVVPAVIVAANAPAAVSTRDHAIDLRMTALSLFATSGFVEAPRVDETCLELSNACRARSRWSLRITEATPEQLMNHVWHGSSMTILGPLSRTRLQPRRNVMKVILDANRVVTFASWPATTKVLEFGAGFNRPVEGVVLPEGLESLAFGVRFNQPVSRVRWPSTLRELTFGNDFNQPVSGIDLPAGLQRLDFGGRFNFAISAVGWPEGLRHLRFGHGFNREIASVRWPPKLESLVFCGEFQQRIEDVKWPVSLQHIELLGDFNQPVDAVQWPVRLRAVHFGDGFRKSLVNVRWPGTLERLVLGCSFDRSLKGCVWPASLKELVVPYERLLAVADRCFSAIDGCGSDKSRRGASDNSASDGFFGGVSPNSVADGGGNVSRKGNNDFEVNVNGNGCHVHRHTREIPACCKVSVLFEDSNLFGNPSEHDDDDACFSADRFAGHSGSTGSDSHIDSVDSSEVDGDRVEVTDCGEEKSGNEDGDCYWDDDDDDDEDADEGDDHAGRSQGRGRRGSDSFEGLDVFGYEDEQWDMADPWDPRNAVGSQQE